MSGCLWRFRTDAAPPRMWLQLLPARGAEARNRPGLHIVDVERPPPLVKKGYCALKTEVLSTEILQETNETEKDTNKYTV